MNLNIIPASTDGQVQDPQSRHRPAALAPASAFHGGPINILIVDDEPKNLTVLETVLNDPGYRLVRAESADQALLALVNEDFALLILDIRMPGMTGFELAQLIKERKKTARVPIIFLTAYYNEDPHVLEGYGTGAVDYLHKPVNSAILRSKVAVFAELHSKSRALLAEVNERRRAEEQLRELNETLEQRVTERTAALVRTTAILKETGERYRSLFDSSLDAIFSLDAGGRFLAANPAALRLTSRTLEELTTLRFLDLCAPDQQEATENAFCAVLGRQSLTLDSTVITATGERRDLFISAAPAIVDGEVSGFSCIARDITDRKQAQEAVRQSEARLSGIISSAMDAIITIDQTQCVTDFNNAAEQMFGWAAADAVGQPIDRFIPAQSWAVQAAHIEMAGLTHGTTHQIGALGIIYGHRANGEEFPIDTSISQLQSQAGNLYTVILRDVTERVRQEEALRESEARFRDLIQALPAALYTCDERGRVMLYNQAATALWGREPEIGRDLWCGSWKIYRPDGAPLPLDECPMAVTLREGRAIRGQEIVIERPDGTRRHVLPHPEPLLNNVGVVVGAVNMLIDITDQKQADQAVANLAAIVTSSDDAIVGKDLRGIVTSWNRAAERLFGYTAMEMIGQSVTRLIPPERHDEESHILGKIIRGERIEHYETIRRRKDGTELTVSLTVSPVVNSQGRIVGASKIARNITEQKRIEAALLERDRALTTVNDALKKQAVALAEANKELEGFSYSVSHDLRAPLRTIDAFSRIVEEDHGEHLNDEARRGLGIVRKAVAQAGELIDDLLEFSKLGRQGMNFRLVKMAGLAREAADDLRIMQEGRQIDLTIGDLPSCQGDRRFLKLVWTNLLTNAFKYTKNRTESRIEVGWMPDDASPESVIYYVKDNGIGFNMAYAHKLFGVFQRLHRKEDFDGTGVGLAVVQRIVQRHGGRVWAEGKVDGGATFFVSLRKAMA